MPHGVGVVDALKNLIRHGKHAQRHRHPDHQPHPPPAPPPPPTATVPILIPDNTASRGLRHPDQQTGSPPRDMVQSIVIEERKAKEKMPDYKGLQDYRLEQKMGDGAFSNVFKATESSSARRVAVKIVRKYELTSSQASEKHLNFQFKKKPRVTERANILKEVQIMRGTSHPSIVKLYSFFESEDHYFLVMELMEGGELFHQIVKLTYFSENLSRHVILQVAHGIRYLHEERGVVHRDIKPENLLFECIDIIPSRNLIKRPYDDEKEDEGEFIPGVGGGGIGRVKIADFGLSKVVWNEETMTPCGTVGYTAPEIVKDERYSKSVDMWALGCVLYTLLCGFPPFYDENIQVLTEKVASGYYTFLSPWWDDISYSAKDLITHLLCVDAVQRYTIDEFLAHPWCNAAPAPPPPPTPYMYPHLTLEKRPLDSPLLRGPVVHGGIYNGRSPGINSLKEAFDVTYAVHRMEEEGRRQGGHGRRGGVKGFLTGLNEDDEEGEEDEETEFVVEADTESAQQYLAQQHQHHRSLMDGTAGQRDQGKGRIAHAIGGTAAGYAPAAAVASTTNSRAQYPPSYNPNPIATKQREKEKHKRGGRGAFELDMHNATLLERRRGTGVIHDSEPAHGRTPLRMEGIIATGDVN